MRFGALRKCLTVFGFCAVFFFAFSQGFNSGKNKVFPYEQIRWFNWQIKPEVVVEKELTQFNIFRPKVDVVFVGDSLTSEGRWTDMFPNQKIANRGVNGETIQEIYQRVDDIIAMEPSKIFLMAGMNDVFRFIDTKTILETFVSVINKLRAPGRKIYLQSTLECSEQTCGEKLDSVRRLNANLQDIAYLHPDVVWIDVNKSLADIRGLKDRYSADGIHINAAGYKAWREILVPYMQPFKSRTSLYIL